MKQYIKKALWIIPFIFSLNLSGSTWYFVGHLLTTPSYNGSNPSNWNSTSTGTGTPAGSFTTPSGAASIDVFDLQGQQITFQSTNSFGEVKFVSSTAGATMTGNSGCVISVATINPPIFDATNVTYDFYTNNTTFVYASTSANTSISSLIYRNVRLYTGEKFINNGSVEIRGTLTMVATNSSTIKGTYLRIFNTTTLVSGSTIVYKSSNTGNTNSTPTELKAGNCKIDIAANLVDQRGSGLKIFSVPVSVYLSNYAIQGDFLDLNIYNNSYAAGNINVYRNLELAYSPSDPFLSLSAVTTILDVNGNTITMKGADSKFSTAYDPGDDSYSRMDLTDVGSTLILENNQTQLDPEFFGNLPVSTSVNLDIYSLHLTASNSTFQFAGNYTINNTLLLGGGSQIELNNATITIDGGVLKLTTTSTSPITTITGTTNILDLNNGTLNVNQNAASTSIPSGIIDNQTIKFLIVNFTSSGTFTLTENYKILDNIDLSTNGSKLSLNGFSIDLFGTITNTNGSSGGKFIGHNTSDFRCSTTNVNVGTFYFDQTNSNNYTLQNLSFTNGASCTLGSNLILENGINLGSGTPGNSNIALTIGSNTLTFSGTQANPVLSRSSGTINPASGTIKYAQTANQGYGLTLASYSQNINNLSLAFTHVDGGILTPDGSMTVNGILDLGDNKNTLSLNGNTFTAIGSINSTGGKFRGSSTSNLFVQSNSDLYFDQTSEENRTLKNLTIGASAVNLRNWLSITGGTASSGYGIVDVIAASNNLYTNGYLTLKSNENGTAMISSNPGNIAYSSSSNDGTLLVENYIGSSGRGRQYRFLSSPVSGGVFLQWRDSLNNRSGRGIHITGDKTKTKETSGTPTPIDSFDMSTTNFPSAFYYDETKAGSITGIGTNSGAAEDAGWIRLPQANTNTIENGKGYRILVRGDRTRWIVSGGNSTDYDANNTTIQTRGGYVAGPVNVPIKNSGSNTNNGINLVGNPYACAIDWQQVYYACSTTVDPTYVLYDPVKKSWQSYNANSTTPSSYQYISPGQGFLVYTTSTSSTNVVFPTAAKTTAQAGARVFTEIKTNHLVTHLRKDTTAADMNIIYFLKGATNYYDKYDAGHIQNDNVNLSSLDSTNTLYNINCLDSLTGSRIVPMSVYGTPKGSYTMTFSDVNTFNNHDIFLVDNFLNKTTKVDDMTQYQIDITDDKFSYAEGRLFISFEPKAASSVVSINKTENFKVSPNPVKDQLSVTMQKPVIGDIEYDIVNIQGQLISKGIISSGSNKIQTSQLSTGIYFINLRAENQTQSIKFIK